MKLPITLLITLLFTFTPALMADVYLLKPGASEEAIHVMLKPKEVLKEKVKINGSEGSLIVNSVDLSIGDCYSALDEILKKYKGKKKDGAIRIDIPKDHFISRYYIFSSL